MNNNNNNNNNSQYKYTNINHSADLLKKFLLHPKTTKHYTKCLTSFLTYIQIHYPRSPIFTHSLSTLSSSDRSFSSSSSSSSSVSSSVQLISELDRLLTNYMNYLYSGHGYYYQASYTYNSLCFYIPQCKNILYESRQRLKAWDKKGKKDKVYKTPLTLELTYVIAVSLIKANYIHSAIGVLLSFECYLRIGELCALRICDIGLPTVSTNMIIGLTQTKTGPNQSVIVRCSFITSLILLLLLSISTQLQTSQEKLFSFSEISYRRDFASACTVLGLSCYHFTPHCLRHGGATHDHVINQIDINNIIERGRWAVVKSARTYIQSGTYLSIHVKEKELTLLGKTIIQNSKQMFELLNSKLKQE